MCGIIGIVGKEPVKDRLIEGLRRLEYRGYDSAGIAIPQPQAGLARRRAMGKLRALEAVLAQDPIDGTCGIGHTRWATHGAPSVANAHPHQTDRVSIVHNGIIENFLELKSDLEAGGATFESETDTEVIAKMIDHHLNQGKAPMDAFRATLQRLSGAFALGAIFSGDQELLLAARRGSPLVVGYGDGEMFIGSDALALSDLSSDLLYLEEGDSAALTRSGAQIFDAAGTPVKRAVVSEAIEATTVSKGPHRHFMHKEIFEQPQVITQTLAHYIDPVQKTLREDILTLDLAGITSVTLVSCGTAYYAGCVARYWLEQIARIPARTEIASEFRYGAPVLDPTGLVVFVSQSGETADTLAALRLAKAEGVKTAAVVNVPTSSIAREVDHVLPTFAGPEIGVASTKAFTCQLAVLACLALALAHHKGGDRAAIGDWVTELSHIPGAMSDILQGEEAYRQVGDHLAKARDILFVGRGIYFPIALEGALKLKEISYIHAEGYAAGELKHGPIALVDETVPVIGLAPYDRLYEKTLSNLKEIEARGGRLVLVSDRDADLTVDAALHVRAGGLMSGPVLYAVPVQLLAYHTALAKGTDVDQPRNLAKSVTVE